LTVTVKNLTADGVDYNFLRDKAFDASGTAYKKPPHRGSGHAPLCPDPPPCVAAAPLVAVLLYRMSVAAAVARGGHSTGYAH
jgi:hypothetical protein